MRFVRILGVLLLCVTLGVVYLFPDQPVSAVGQASKPTEGTPSKHPLYGEGTTETGTGSGIGINAMQYFKVGKSHISGSGNIVMVTGSTEAYRPVSTIGIDLYLQRWDASKGRWVDVVHAGEFKRYNTHYIYDGIGIQVVRGYYYRTRALHWVVHNGTVEQVSSYTSYIYVP